MSDIASAAANKHASRSSLKTSLFRQASSSPSSRFGTATLSTPGNMLWRTCILTARWDAKAARAFLRKAIERVRLHRPVTICTDKAPTCRRVIEEENRRYDPHFDSIRHVDKKWRNNLIESDHAVMKRCLGYRQSFRSLRTAKATLSGIETVRTIKIGHIHHKQPGIRGEVEFIRDLFNSAA
jgi:IS6 family transposase